MGLILLALLFVAMWFFTIRPQQQRLRNQRALTSSLSVGDEVVTVGGLLGRITAIADQEVRLDLGGGTEVRVARNAVSGRLATESAGDATPDSLPDPTDDDA